MEVYLKEQYGVIEDKYLTCVEDIEDHFKDIGREYLDCGQGYYQDEARLICKIGEKFYQVDIKADIDSQRMDVGDRVYSVDCITSVRYKEIEKPKPKEILGVTYCLHITNDKKNVLENFMKESKMEFTVK